MIIIMISNSTFGRWSTPKKARARVTKPLLANRAGLSSGTDPLDRRMYWSCTRWKGNRNIATKVIHLLTPPKMVIIAGAGVFSGRNRVPTRPSSLTWDLSTLSPQLSFIQPQFFWRLLIGSSWRQKQRLVSPFCNCYWPGPTFAKSCFDTSRVMFLTKSDLQKLLQVVGDDSVKQIFSRCHLLFTMHNIFQSYESSSPCVFTDGKFVL